MTDFANIDVSKDRVPVGSTGNTVTVTNLAGDTLYYGDRNVSATANIGSLTAGQSAVVTVPQDWLLSASFSSVQVQTDSAGIPASQLPPSAATVTTQLGASSGNDTAVINAALAGSGRVRGRPGQNYLISSPLVIPSNTELDMTGCTVTLIAASNRNMLNNTAVAPERTITDGAMSAASAILTSATANFTAGDIGKPIGVVGGENVNGMMLYTTVASVQGSTQATLSTNCVAAGGVSNTTVYIYRAARDTKIRVIGGTWNAGNIDANTSFNRAVIRLRRLDDVKVIDVNVRAQGLTQQGGRYGVNLGDVTEFLVSGPTFSTVGDGVHINGPASAGRIEHVEGTTGDDMVALSSVDSVIMTDVEGDITNVAIEGIYPNNCAEAVSLFSGLGSGNVQRVLRGISVRNVRGSVNGTGANIAMVKLYDYQGGTNIECEIENVSGTVPVGQPLVYINCTQGKLVVLRNIKWLDTANAPTSGIINIVGATVQYLVLENIYQYGAPSGNSVGVLISGATTITRLTVNGMYVPDNPATHYGLWLSASSTTISAISIRSPLITAQFGRLVNNPGPANITTMLCTDGVIGAALGIYNSGTGAFNTRIYVTDFESTGTYAITSGHPYELNVAETTLNTSGAAFQANNAAATPVRIRLAPTVKQLGAGALISRTGAQAMSVTGTSLPVDQTLLTPADGDLAYNNNASPLNGVGVAIWNATAAKWKNVYSGTTS